MSTDLSREQSGMDWRRWVLDTPEAAAVVWDRGLWSWKDLAGVVDGWVQGLQRGGLEPGDVVALDARLGPGFVVALLSLWRAGAVAAPVFDRLTKSERERQDLLLRPAWALGWDGAGDGVGLPVLQQRRPRTESLAWRERGGDRRRGAVLLTTSGSSGEPRGVLLSHEALWASAAATAERLALSPRDRWGLLLSPAHAGGLSTLARGVFLGGGVRLWAGPRPYRSTLASIEAGEVSHLSVVPALADRLLDQGLARPPSTFRCLLVGGAAAGPSLRRRAEDVGVPLGLTWGMTETGGQVATAPPEEVASGRGSVGRPLPGMEVSVADDGRLSVRGPFLASAAVDTPGGDPSPLPADEEGWYTTTDVGERDEDGRLRILGRADDVIVTGGTNVHPAEVEDVLSSHPAVEAVGVVGRPDDRWGQLVVAGVVAKAGKAATEEGLKAWCGDHLTRSRCPTHIVFLSELPRTPTGKVARRRLAALLA